MKTFILTSLLFLCSYEPKDLAATINIYRFWSGANELSWSDNIDTVKTKPVVLTKFETNESLLKDADSIRVIKVNPDLYEVYIK